MQALHIIPSILSSHVSEGVLVNGSSLTRGEGLLSKFAKTLDSADIIASNRVSGVSWAGLESRTPVGRSGGCTGANSVEHEPGPVVVVSM